MIFEKVQKIICEQLGIDEEEVTSESQIVNDLDADELDVIEIIMVIEEEFDIEIFDTELDEIDTVEDLVECIKSKK